MGSTAAGAGKINGKINGIVAADSECGALHCSQPGLDRSRPINDPLLIKTLVPH